MSNLELELKEIRNIVEELNRKIDSLIANRELLSMMTLSERSLRDFLFQEPDIYALKDLKVRHR